MKIAVACDDTVVSPHFGRCEKFLLAEVEGSQIRPLDWVANPGHEPGAIPDLMRAHEVALVVAGGAGPRAQQLLAEHGIALLTGISGEALGALQALADGTLEPGPSACDHGE